MNKESLGAFEGAIIAPTPAPYDPSGKLESFINREPKTETVLDGMIASLAIHNDTTATVVAGSNKPVQLEEVAEITGKKIEMIHHEEDAPPAELLTDTEVVPAYALGARLDPAPSLQDAPAEDEAAK